MTYHPNGVCSPWPIRENCVTVEDVSEEDLNFWRHVASQILWMLSGRKFGPCPITVRPCLKRCADKYSGYQPEMYAPFGMTGPYTPTIRNGAWYNNIACGCKTDCSCSELCEVRLQTPVYDIIEVLIDGAILDPNDYRVDAAGKLVRQNGGCWPDCQRLDLPAGAEGTFVVTYELGLPLNESAIAAVSELTNELIKSCTGSKDCRLPKRATRLIRNNVQIDFIDPLEYLDKGRTGLPFVDLWLAAVNPYGLKQPGRVLSPDYRPPRRTTWTAN